MKNGSEADATIDTIIFSQAKGEQMHKFLINDHFVESNDDESAAKRGATFESYIHYIYVSLLRLEGEEASVSSNFVLKDSSGIKHEFDVFYQFQKAGVRHNVAIECKDWSKPVSKGEIMEFAAKVQRIGNVTGIVISRNGYQSGAIAYADSVGIPTLTPKDIPTIPEIAMRKIEKLLLPDEKSIGEPFWILMEFRDGRLTGNYWTLPQSVDQQYPTMIPLFLSSADAWRVLRGVGLATNYVVRGMSQHQLNALFDFMEIGEASNDVGPAIVIPTLGSRPIENFQYILLSRDEIKREFYVPEL